MAGVTKGAIMVKVENVQVRVGKSALMAGLVVLASSANARGLSAIVTEDDVADVFEVREKKLVEELGGTVRFAEPELGGATALVELPQP